MARGPRDPAARRGQVRVERVPASVVRPVRHAVLRPGRLAAESVYPEDLDPETVHVAALAVRKNPGAEGDVVLAVGTAIRQSPPWDPAASGAWRLRGMATDEEERGHGLGTLVLGALMVTVAQAGARLVWCNARVPARRLYERAGFTTRGTTFEIPVIGPHVVMWRSIGLCQPIGVVPPERPASPADHDAT